MPPAVRNFNHQALPGPFSHPQQPHLQHLASQHQSSGSSYLPPPLSNPHHALNQGNHNSNINLFSQSGNTNGLAAGFGGTGGFGGGGTGLASQGAMSAFAHGAALQQQQQAREQVSRGSTTGGSKNPLKNRIRDVWRGNLAQEMQLLRSLVEKYPYISMVSLPDNVLSIVLAVVVLSRLNRTKRTPNFLVSSRDRWEPSPRKRITTIKLSDATWTCSRSSNLASPSLTTTATLHHHNSQRQPGSIYRRIKTICSPVLAHGNSTSNSPLRTTCTIQIQSIS